MQARRAQAVAEEFETMRAIAKKEREVAKKLEAVRIETEARIAKEAALRDAERKKKVAEKLKKSQARSQRPAVLRCLHFIQTTRLHQRRRWVVSFLILSRFGS